MISTDLTTTEVPNASISNGVITANLYLPDIEKGYYRSTRFDWSGVISKLEYKGHNYFGQWFDNYTPKKHDAICGPVDEFGAVGYENVKIGETFLKIGVGMLKKSTDDSYNSFSYYDIENSGERFIKQVDNAIEFVHLLTDISGYACEYRKVVTLTPGKPELVISYKLKNTGRKGIKTTVYNHNFFTIDNQHTGPDIVVKFPFKINGEGEGIGDIAQIINDKIIFLKPLEKTDRVYMGNIVGFDKAKSDHSFCIMNNRTGAGVKLNCNQPLARLVFWAYCTTSCPEPYISINVKPMQEFAWENRYEFFTF